MNTINTTKADRDLDKLNSVFKHLVLNFIEHAKYEGYDIFVTEGYRTQERQEYLYSLGRTRPGNIVTWIKNGSIHQKGKAIDIAFNGKELYPKDYQTWRRVADIAKEHGLDWGYDLWGLDKPHFQISDKIPNNNSLDFKKYIMEITPSQKYALTAVEYAAKNLYEIARLENDNENLKQFAGKIAEMVRDKRDS